MPNFKLRTVNYNTEDLSETESGLHLRIQKLAAEIDSAQAKGEALTAMRSALTNELTKSLNIGKNDTS